MRHAMLSVSRDSSFAFSPALAAFALSHPSTICCVTVDSTVSPVNGKSVAASRRHSGGRHYQRLFFKADVERCKK